LPHAERRQSPPLQGAARQPQSPTRSHCAYRRVLEDYDTEEWVLKQRVSFLELFGQMSSLDNFKSIVVAIHPDRNLIFILQDSSRKLISYDMDRTVRNCMLSSLLDTTLDLLLHMVPISWSHWYLQMSTEMLLLEHSCQHSSVNCYLCNIATWANEIFQN
jgi:hypothetical protein